MECGTPSDGNVPLLKCGLPCVTHFLEGAKLAGALRMNDNNQMK